jgi:hypothetical protein
MIQFVVERRRQVEVNTDPMRRCYYGVHASSEFQWTSWEALESWPDSQEVAEKRIEFWRNLNDYAVSQRGEGARSEFRIVEKSDEAVFQR